MPEFNWVANPPHGGCLTCLSQNNDKGFVNTYASTELRNDMGEAIGEVDIVFCADCLLQQAKLVGAAMPAEVEAFAYREHDLTEENEKLKDEVLAWKERLAKLVDLKLDDVGLDQPKEA